MRRRVRLRDAAQVADDDVALDKLGARGISAHEAEQLLRNRHVIARNPGQASVPGDRVVLIGQSDGDRTLALVI